MKHSSAIDRNTRVSFSKKEREIKLFKFIRKNIFLSLPIRASSARFLSKKLFKVRLHNYCVLTGRSRGILSKFRISRMVFKKLASFGNLYGIKKK